MDYTEYTLRKIDSAKIQLHQLRCVDFPYDDPRRALLSLADALELSRKVLNEALDDGDPDAIAAACIRVNSKIVELHPILGFLLRSTNIRNSFEINDPLKRLASSLLDKEPSLVLSSEWAFEPYTYPILSGDLPDFVFIGLPVSEVENALILPLAGHELGHSVWRRGGLRNEMESSIRTGVIEQFSEHPTEFQALFGQGYSDQALVGNRRILASLASACRVAARQSEKTFCDLLGVRIFGEAFLHSFEYLLCPSLGGPRPETYPRLTKRVDYMIRASARYNQSLRYPHSFLFDDTDRNLEAIEQFILAMADSATDRLVEQIIEKVKSYCASRVPELDFEAVDRLVNRFRRCVPAEGANSIAEIVNAGWLIYKEFATFGPDTGADDAKFELLNNLLFKSMEIFEYEARMKES